MGSSEGRGGVMGDNGRNKSSEGGAAISDGHLNFLFLMGPASSEREAISKTEKKEKKKHELEPRI